VAAASLRERHEAVFLGNRVNQQERVVRAFHAVASLWRHRLEAGWIPPDDSSFPWAQERLSLAALLPGLSEARDWLKRSNGDDAPFDSSVAALILAGNTPLLAWSPIAAALLSGHAVFIKQSRDETVWTRLLVESLVEVDAELASLIHLDLWPGEDARTTALVTAADAVIAYGSDATLAALRGSVPGGTPFFGFGHAVSIGIVTEGGNEEAGRFARDILMYGQGGCLSAHAVLVQQRQPDSDRALIASQTLALGISPVTDPAIALSVRQARDMALFLGSDVSVIGDPGLRWTLLLRASPEPLEIPAGLGVVQVTPVERIEDRLYDQLGAMRGYISSVGVAGTLTVREKRVLLDESISRICRAGEMQMPPLDWPNGRINLLAKLRNTNQKAET
jgi:hypothetical protein